METKLNYKDGILRAELSGEIDHSVTDSLRCELDCEIETRWIRKLVFDFKKVSFMDSSGIGVVVGRYKKIDALGGETVLVNVCSQVEKILEISGIKTIIKCFKGEEEDE